MDETHVVACEDPVSKRTFYKFVPPPKQGSDEEAAAPVISYQEGFIK